jgi:ATP-dependent DNA helicase RecG
VRRFSSTKKADRTEERQLLELAAKVPFDDRINHQASLNDLKLPLIQSFLQEVKSSLFEQSRRMEFQDLCKQMGIVRGPNEYLRPVNVGLMFFNEKPERFFKGAKIEIVEYKDDVGDDFAEKVFIGPIHDQLRQSLQYLKTSVLQEQVKKIPGVAKAHRFYNYPYEALEEALANAVYHRSYEDSNSIEISVWHDRIDILSYPGPVPPVDNKQLKKSRVVARFYRNRRVGDFLKELDLTEGRGTGIPKIRKAMRDNGSPPARFETDRSKTYFLTTLPVHQAAARPIEIAEPEAISTKILRFCRSPRSRKEILEYIGLTNHPKNYKAHIVPLIENGYLELTIPDKPRSSKQRYITNARGQRTVK